MEVFGKEGLELGTSDVAVQLLSDSREVTGLLVGRGGTSLADLGDLGAEETTECLNLLIGSALVLIEKGTEFATGTDRVGGSLVGELLDRKSVV